MISGDICVCSHASNVITAHFTIGPPRQFVGGSSGVLHPRRHAHASRQYYWSSLSEMLIHAYSPHISPRHTILSFNYQVPEDLTRLQLGDDARRYLSQAGDTASRFLPLMLNALIIDERAISIAVSDILITTSRRRMKYLSLLPAASIRMPTKSTDKFQRQSEYFDASE